MDSQGTLTGVNELYVGRYKEAKEALALVFYVYCVSLNGPTALLQLEKLRNTQDETLLVLYFRLNVLVSPIVLL